MKNNFLTKLSAVALAGVMALTFAPAASLTAFAADAATTEAKTTPVYRLYNRNNGEHLLTTDKTEYDKNVELGLDGEGEAWTAPTTGETVYRVYNPNSGEHLLLADREEYDNVVLAGWDGEGPKMYSDVNKGVPVYRLFNPNSHDAGSHLYTTDRDEYNALVKAGWKGEGVKFYGVAKGQEALKIVSAKQTSATTAEVVFSRELNAGEKLTVSRGSSDVAISAQSNKDATYTLTFASKLVKDTYKVTVTLADKSKVEGTFAAEAEKFTDIKWLSDVLNVKNNTSSGMQEVSTYVKGVDQWGDEMSLPNPVFTASEGDATYDNKTGKLTLKKTGTDTFMVGRDVTVICVLQSEAMAKNHTYKVAMANSAAKITLGDMTTDDEDYAKLGADGITEKALEDGAYYIPVDAVDESGVSLSEKDLDGMLNQTLFVLPNTNAGVLYFAGFTTKNGKPAMKIAAGKTVDPGASNTDFDLVTDMPGVLSVMSTGSAGSQTKTITIHKNPVIKELTVSLPSDLYSGKKSEFTVSAVDQYGNAVSLFDYAVAAKAADKFTFADGTIINASASTIDVEKDRSKKEVKFYITPATSATGGFVSLSGTTAGLGTVFVNAAYAGTRHTDSVVSLDSDVKTTMVEGTPAQALKTPTFAWNDGVTMTAADFVANAGMRPKALKGTLAAGSYATGAMKYDGKAGGISPNTAATDGDVSALVATGESYAYAYAVTDSTVASLKETDGSSALDGTTVADTWTLVPGKAGNTILTVYLYTIKRNDSTPASLWTVSVDSKTFDIVVKKEGKVDYELEAESSAGLYPNKADTLNLTLVDKKSGAAVDQTKIKEVSFSAADPTYTGGFDFTDAKGTGQASVKSHTDVSRSWGAGKTTKVTATASIEDNGDVKTITTTFDVNNTAPHADRIEWYKGITAGTAYGSLTATDKAKISTSSDVTISNISSDFCGVYVVDQYGNEITSDGGHAAIVELKNAYDESVATHKFISAPSAEWDTGDKDVVKITNSTPALATGDTFQVVITSGTVSRVFYVTMGTMTHSLKTVTGSGVATESPAGTITITGLTAKDENSATYTPASAVTGAAVSNFASAGVSTTTTEAGDAAYNVTTAGAVTVTVTRATAVDATDGFTFKIGDTTITLKSTAGGAAGTALTDWAVTIS